MITGAPQTIEQTDHLVLTRTFKAPIEDVWAAVTESDRLARWFGTWEGDPATGRVAVTMIFEDDASAEPYVIEVCEAPTRLRVHNDNPVVDEVWTLDLRLSHQDGVTTLAFAQVLTDPTIVVHVGPGWEFYLDRLEESVRTGSTAETAFDGYLDLSAEYAAAFGVPDLGEAHLRTAISQMSELLRAGDAAPDAPTPCEGWNVRQLSEHVVASVSGFARSLRGEEVDWSSPAPTIDGDLVEAFELAAEELLRARHEAGEEAGPPDWNLAELAVHTWDLATALGRPTAELDQQIAERGGAFMRANLTDDNRGGVFDPAVDAPEGADAYASLAAFAGRRV